MLLEVEDYEQVLQACRYALDVQRQLFEQAPQVLEYRALLDDRHVRLERILGHMGRLDEVRDSILEREKLWIGNPARLRTLAEALNKLADEALALRPQDPRTKGYRDEAAPGPKGRWPGPLVARQRGVNGIWYPLIPVNPSGTSSHPKSCSGRLLGYDAGHAARETFDRHS